MIRSFAALCAIGSLAALGLAELASEAKLGQAELKEVLEKARVKHDLPALAAAVVNSEGLLVTAAVGVRKRGEKVQVTNDDLFHLGSATKPITAWLLAWLIERGMLTWDTPLEKVFPELAKEWSAEQRRITVEELLTHHAGLPDNWPGGWWILQGKGTPRDLRLAMMKKLGNIKLVHMPGEKYKYSNLGFTVAGAVAERRGKDSWENLLKKAVFEPLTMKAVGHGPMGKEGAILQPWQHHGDGAPISPKWNNDNPPVMGPAGRIHASLPDWSKFVTDVLRGARGEKALLKPATYDAMFDSPFKDTFYCRGGWIGQRRNAQGKGLILGHDGSNTQNYCSALILPDANLAVLVAANQGGDPGRKGCHEVRDALVKKMVGK